MNSTNPTATVQQSPEQILRSLELQLGEKRVRREKARTLRISMLVAGILVIVIGAGAALLALEHLLEEMRGAERVEIVGRDDSTGASAKP